jgi:heat shock protein beta
MAERLQAEGFDVCTLTRYGRPKLIKSDKHSTFSTTFPIYILERNTRDIPIAPQTPKADGDPDEFDDDLDSDDQSDTKVKTRHDWVSEWVRVNDKAPIWMR